MGYRAGAIAAIFLFASCPAFAYFDPGAGSYALQLLIGALLAAGFLAISLWRKARARLSRKRGEGKDP
jgi:hypothetical protein